MLSKNKYRNNHHETGSCACFLCLGHSSETHSITPKKKNIKERLKSLPEIKARPGFEQRIAAAFAMELENEILRKNQSWLQKNKSILLPDLLPNNRS